MTILLTIQLIIIIFLTYQYCSLLKDKEQLEKKIHNLDVNYYSLKTERNSLEKDYSILKKELDLLKELEQSKLKDNILVLSNENISLKSTFKNKRVLVGDYNIEMLKHTRKIFLSLGFEVDIVQSGGELIHQALNFGDYDVIVTNNLYKDNYNGKSIINELREYEEFTIPIVVLTTSTGQIDEFIKEIGFDGHLEMPLTQEQVEDVMKKLLLESR